MSLLVKLLCTIHNIIVHGRLIGIHIFFFVLLRKSRNSIIELLCFLTRGIPLSDYCVNPFTSDSRSIDIHHNVIYVCARRVNIPFYYIRLRVENALKMLFSHRFHWKPKWPKIFIFSYYTFNLKKKNVCSLKTIWM